VKILLINPPPFCHGRYSRFLEKEPIQTYTMPLGLGYIASFLEKHGYNVSIIDAYAKNYSYQKLEVLIKDISPDIVGITCLSDQRASWFRLIELIRRIDNSIKIVLGGPHPSLMTEQVLINFKPDAIVLGEGEITMLELVKAWESGEDLSDVKGIAYLDKGRVKRNDERERIKDLDSLPFPARHLVDFDDYNGWSFMNLVSSKLGIKKIPKYATILTSRGCNGNCGYCSSPLIWKRQWTARSAQNVVDEIELLKKCFKVEFIIIVDDIFTIDQKRVIAISKEIVKRNLDVMWGFETSVNFVSEEMLRHAKQAGCCCILYGVESGSKAVLSNIYKVINEEKVIKAFNMTKELKIITGAFLMVGNPGEDERSINETIKLLKKIDPDIILPQITMITPCTRIYYIAKEKGFINDDYWLTDLPFPYYTCENDLKTLLRWHRKLFYYNHNKMNIFLRTIRDFVELNANKKGIEGYKKLRFSI